jgi:ATP-grasp domain, R2K clade family 3
MKFLIQHNLMNAEQLKAVADAVKPFPHQFIGLIPFSRELTSEDPIEGIEYIPYGSTLLSTLGLGYKWKGLYFDLDNFNYGKCAENRSDMLNAELIVTAKDAIKLMEDSPKRDWFIRPSLDLKHFSGQVIDSEECVAWFKDAMQHDMSGTYKIDEDMMVVLAEPKNIQAEWRWFVVGGKIVDGAMYRSNNQLVKLHETDTKVIKEAQSFADKWLPNQNCVMDLALVDNEVKVIEFNCINCSGFYGHDIPKIFASIYKNELTR